MAHGLIDIRSIPIDRAPRLSATGYGWNQLSPLSTSIDLYEDGCWIDGEPNCTAACAEPAIAWESFYTLMNCLMYPTISGLLASGSLTTTGMDVAASFQIYRSRLVDLSVMQIVIDACARDFCKSRNDQRLDDDCFSGFMSTSVISHDPVAYVEANSRPIMDFATEICPDSPSLGNVDIGGIGVYLSYIVQLFLILTVWAYLRMLGYLIPRPPGKPWQPALDQRDAVMVVGLCEFQQAQTYFALTLSLATFIALAGDGTIFEAATYQQIGITIALFGDAATTSVVCMTFGIYLLHKSGNEARLPAALSSIATVLATVAFGLTRRPLHNLRPRAKPTTWLPSCGGRNTPAKFCTAPDKLHYSTKIEAPITAVCSTIMLLTLLCYRISRPIVMPHTRHAIAEFALATPAVIVIMWLISPEALGYPHSSSFDWVSDGTWTFGQIIAISIWAPALCEFAWASKYGIVNQQPWGALPGTSARYFKAYVKK